MNSGKSRRRDVGTTTMLISTQIHKCSFNLVLHLEKKLKYSQFYTKIYIYTK